MEHRHGGRAGPGALQDLPDDVARLRDLVQTHECINLAHLADQFLGEPLRHAAADDELLAGPAAQTARFVRFEDGFNRFLLGRVDETRRC